MCGRLDAPVVLAWAYRGQQGREQQPDEFEHVPKHHRSARAKFCRRYHEEERGADTYQARLLSIDGSISVSTQRSTSSTASCAIAVGAMSSDWCWWQLCMKQETFLPLRMLRDGRVLTLSRRGY